MLTDRFHKVRKEELNKVFSKINISEVWRKVVRDQFKNMDILDIFDHYDFFYNIDERAQLLRNDLLNGNYQCSLPLIYRIEKKFGICRHVVIPQPVDALILQVITETLRTEILNKQPSQNAFYSHNKHQIDKPHEIDEYGIQWKELWKKMQKQIYKFKEEKELIVVSDLANYYDSIDIHELRKKITSYVDDKEVLIDILFKIIEKISWLPDYLPYSERGLPIANLEGVRLLAHSFLFELDSIIKDKTDDSFTRWMDDLVIGVNSRSEAVETLSSASDILKSRGLALSLAKTSIYDSETAEFNFLIEENQYLDLVDLPILFDSEIPVIEEELVRRFDLHLEKNSQAKYFEKVTKRYITAFGKINSEKLLAHLPALYEECPSVRPNALFYLTGLGYNKTTVETTLGILDKLLLYDDISLFKICQLVTLWNVKNDEEGDSFLNQVHNKVQAFSEKRKNPFDFYCLLWIKAKYEHPEKLLSFISTNENIWQTQPFLRRQVTAIMARLLPFKENWVRSFLERQISSGETQVISVANHILKFSERSNTETKINMYLFPEHQSRNYPLQKFLVLCSVLNSKKCREEKNLAVNIKNYIHDSYYRKWIEYQYDIK